MGNTRRVSRAEWIEAARALRLPPEVRLIPCRVPAAPARAIDPARRLEMMRRWAELMRAREGAVR